MYPTAREGAMALVPEKAHRIIASLDHTSVVLGKAVSWVLIPMMLSLVYEVCARYFFNAPTEWAMDMALILYGINFMVGSPYCLEQGQHIRTDFLYNAWSIKTKACVDIFVYIVFFFPVHLVFLDVGWRYFWKSFMLNESMVTSPWMPIVWPLKFAIPVCIFFTITQGISEVIKSYYRYKTNTELWPTHEYELKDVD